MLRFTIGRMAISIALLVGIAGCGPANQMSEEELAERHQFRPPFDVEQTVHRHLVPLNPQRIDFYEQQRRDLYDFLVGVGAQPGDTVVVGARRSRLEHRGEIVEFVRRLGLKPDLRLIRDPKPGAEDDGYDTAVLIQFHRYVARNPECGEWKNDYSTRFNNVNPQNFGCANTAALQQQIAYPSALISGETLDFPEGDVAAESVSRYRGRKVEQIKVEAAASK
jgi:pilus biogenesis lipoprotein CpaD